jgi:hypothetical protein
MNMVANYKSDNEHRGYLIYWFKIGGGLTKECLTTLRLHNITILESLCIQETLDTTAILFGAAVAIVGI